VYHQSHHHHHTHTQRNGDLHLVVKHRNTAFHFPNFLFLKWYINMLQKKYITKWKKEKSKK
jgi:hypothetical protein